MSQETANQLRLVSETPLPSSKVHLKLHQSKVDANKVLFFLARGLQCFLKVKVTLSLGAKFRHTKTGFKNTEFKTVGFVV